MQKLNLSNNKQKGAALIIFTVILVLVATTYFVSQLDATGVKIKRDKKTVAALSEAKAALIGYSSSNKRPGALPCPDTNNDGSADTNGNVACYSNIGRLPWKTLGLNDIRDGSNERLWYTLSANFANVPSTSIINSDDNTGLINVCPDNACGDASPIPALPTIAPLPLLTKQVAIVLSAGNLLAGQDRQDGLDSNPNPVANTDNAKKASNYLDSITVGPNQFNNATGSNNGSDYISSGATDTFNDKLLAINSAEVFSNVDKRMQSKATLAEIATCLIEYAQNNNAVNDKRLPWPAPLVLADYSNQNNFVDDATLYTGRIAYQIASSTAKAPIHNWNTGAPSKKNKMEYCSNWPAWWNSWKNYVFYAVSKDFAPNTTLLAPQICSGNCVTVDGIGPFAALLIFSGKKLALQTRLSNVDMANPGNFLEDKNAIEITNNSGVGDYAKITNPTQNDVIICVRQNLTIDTSCSTP